MKAIIKKLVKKNKLIVDSLSLMLATAITAGFGFLFWIIVAHFFRSTTIGFATTLLSVSSLLSLLGLAGFDTIFVRFLAKSEKQNEQINSGLIISGFASALISGIFCLLIPILSPKLGFVLQNPWYIAAFIIFTIFTTWNTLTNAIFVAYRRTSFVFVINLIFSMIKICLPFISSAGGPMTIFSIVGVAQVANVILSIGALMRYFQYTPKIKIDYAVLRELRRFGSTMYVANLLNLLPDSALPIIIIDKLGSIQAAYFYVAFAIANLVYTIAFATNQVLVAEAAHDEKHFIQHARKGILFVLGLLTVTIIFVVVLCPFVLLLFGHTYSNGATDLLRILCFSGFAVMIYSFLSFIFKHQKNLKAMLFMTTANAIAIIGLSLLWAKPYGLSGIGWAWLAGTIIAVLVGTISLVLSREPSLKIASKPKKILISHVYSKDNKGDAALLSVLISDIKRTFHHVSITILTLDSIKPGEMFDGVPVKNSFMFYALTKYRSKQLILLNSLFILFITLLWSYFYKLTGLSLPIDRKLRELCLLYAHADLILPVGGGYIRSQKKGIGSLLNVTLLIHPIHLSHILKKPTVLYTQSIGPFTSTLEEKIVSHAINNCVQAAIIRENTSFKLLQRIGVKDNIYRSVDSGFAFSAQGKTYNVRKLLGIKRRQIVFGITARRWLPGKAQSQYENELAKTVRYIATKHHAAVVFIPQVTAEFHKDDDRLAHQRIYQQVKDLKNVYVIHDKLDHHQIKTVYNALDFVIGTRFHSVIFSLTSYVPAIAIEYEHKTGGIMHDLGLDTWVVKMENVNAINLSKMTDALIIEQRKYRRHLKSVLPEYIAKTNEPIQIVNDAYDNFIKESKTRKRSFYSNTLYKLIVLFIKRAYQVSS